MAVAESNAAMERRGRTVTAVILLHV